MSDDTFWAENRAEFLAEKSTSADPSACGTCRSNVEAGQPVEHDACAQRATLLQAPDHPYYELLAGFSLEENAKLPARFHIPVFDDCGKPNAWLCAVCWEEGQVVGWPCATATKYGTKVFSPLHEAEAATKKQAQRIAQLEDEVVRLRAELAALPAPVVETAFRDGLGNVWPLGHFPAETEAQVLKTTPTIQRTVRISEWTEDPCHPCGCPKRFNRHADGCTVEPDDDMSNADVFTASELYEMDRDDEFMYDAADDARDEDGAS